MPSLSISRLFARTAPAATASALLLVLAACASAPPPVPAPHPTPVPQPPPSAAPGFVTVAAGRLNIRETPSKQAPIVAKVRQGARLEMMGEQGAWIEVRADDATGWVMKQYVRSEGQCPPDREMEILDEPPAVFGETSHGKVVLEALVDEKGTIRSVKVAENTTKDPAFAAAAEEDLRKYKFSPPVKRCKPVGFTYIYTRNF